MVNFRMTATDGFAAAFLGIFRIESPFLRGVVALVWLSVRLKGFYSKRGKTAFGFLPI